MEVQEIHIYKDAPEKPQWGEPCNGCGVCCLAKPCPIGQTLFLIHSGACPAVTWQPALNQYLCGMVITPSRYHRWIPSWADQFLIKLFKRWIASGKGCDSSAEIKN